MLWRIFLGKEKIMSDQEKKMTKYDLKMQRRREAELREKRKAQYSLIGAIAIVIIVVAVIGWKGYESYQEKHGVYVTIGSHNVKKAEYDYYFYGNINQLYSYYGSYLSYFGLDLSESLDEQSYSDTMTWQDYFDQQAVQQLTQVYALSDEADAEGFEYDTTADVDDFVESLETYAESAEMTVSDYLKSAYGDYATLDDVKTYVAQSSRANAYYDAVEDATEVTDDEIQTYYDENKDSYDSVDYLLCEIDADMPEEETEEETVEETDETAETLTEEEQEALEAEQAEKEAAQEAAQQAAMDDAQAKAVEMQEGITDKESFKMLNEEYATDATAAYENTNVKKSSVSSSDVAEWLFDSSRKAGDTTVIEDTSNNAYYVVYFVRRYLDDAKTVDVRHILVKVNSETTDDMTDEEVTAAEEAADAEAKQSAEDIYAEWKNGEATEDSFAELAETYSEDTGSNTNGGLYEAVAQGDMVTDFNDWIFDDARKPGDTEIIETSYGYHVMYFVGDNAEEWHVDIESTLRSNKMSDYLSALMDAVEVKDRQGKIAYLHVTTEETESATESETETTTETETTIETTTETETE
jgi:parvulin-like peptidyl-prolyl isomerase